MNNDDSTESEMCFIEILLVDNFFTVNVPIINTNLREMNKTFMFFCVFICKQVQNLSGGELQRVALALCLGKPADVYLIDEPSAYLDSEQRLHAAKVIKR